MKIVTYEQAVNYLESFIGKVRFEITPEFLKHQDPLERTRVLLSLLGNPQDKFPSVLVGGTSGKGSTAYLISHILTTSGYKTGLTISPHLQKINERIQVSGRLISNGEFISLLTSILSSIEGMKRMSVGVPSYFEILIAMAFKYFADKHVDIAVVEVGMGGEFDATNTLYPLVAVLTNVSLDHTSVLGGTVQKIAKTKVGIIKKLKVENGKLKNNSQLSTLNSQFIAVTGVRQPSVIDIVGDRCKEVGAELYRLHKDFDFKIKKENLEGSRFDVTSAHGPVGKLNGLRNLQLSLLGEYQVGNASLALKTVLELRGFGFKVSEEHIRQALKTAFFPGRFEIISLKDTKILRYKDIKNKKIKSSNILISQYPNIPIVFDGAHNPTKMRAFLTSLRKLFPKQKKIFVVGFKFDKDIQKMLQQIIKVADKIIATEFSGKTDTSINASAETLNIKYQILNIKSGAKVMVEKDSKKALDKAFSLSTIQQFNNSTIIVVTGSLYLVGEIRDML